VVLNLGERGYIDVTSTPDPTRAWDANAARKRISAILKGGQLTYTRHAREEMKKDDLREVDVTNVLRGGHITEPAEKEKGTWRYRVHTNTIWVVVAFRGETELVVVTVWRKR
jgi:phosphoribosylaminoimidazole-succinocarboxamide synthase